MREKLDLRQWTSKQHPEMDLTKLCLFNVELININDEILYTVFELNQLLGYVSDYTLRV